MENQEQINFIKRFTRYNDVKQTFTEGCCYWFAIILSVRFPGSEIMYDEIANHFGTKIGDKIYDITGEVTEKFKWIRWDDLDDEPHRKRIIRDCINF